MFRVRHSWPKLGTGRAWFLGLLALASAAAIAASVERASTWRDRDILIDGQDDDWRGLTMPVKGQRVALGVVNDGEFVYLCLPTKDAGIRSQIAKQGIVVWLDKAGGKRETFGIHFPLGPGRADTAAQPHQPPREGEGRPQDAIGPQDVVGILRRAGRDAQIVPMPQAGGIEGRVGIHDDLVVYELKVPLQQSEAHPFAPDIRPGDVLTLRIETAAYRGPVAPLGVPSGGVVAGGGHGGFGVGIAVGGGTGSPGFGNPLHLTMNVKLASGPAK